MLLTANTFNSQPLTAVKLPANLAKTGSYMFANCTTLKTVTIPEGVREISEGMFSDCTALSTISIPASVTSIGKGAFFRSGLTAITWPASIPVIPDATREDRLRETLGETRARARGIFQNCTKLAVVTLPEGITTIGSGAFNGCTALTNITLPSTIKEIRLAAFTYCTALTAVTIPQTVTAINFPGWDKDGGLNTRSCPKLNLASQAALRRLGAGVRTFIFPDGTQHIGFNAMRNIYKWGDSGPINVFIFPNSIISISGDIFGTEITGVTIGVNVNINMNDQLFRDLSNGFVDFYNQNGKKAGVYTLKDRTWSFTERAAE